MEWSEQQRARLAQEYARIGYVPGEAWPAPPLELTPEQLLALFGRIRDGDGRTGYVTELARLAQK
jgi:hypothetical protein